MIDNRPMLLPWKNGKPAALQIEIESAVNGIVRFLCRRTAFFVGLCMQTVVNYQSKNDRS